MSQQETQEQTLLFRKYIMATLVKRPRRHESGQQDDSEERRHLYINLSHSPASKLSPKICNWPWLIEVFTQVCLYEPLGFDAYNQNRTLTTESLSKKYFSDKSSVRKFPNLPRMVRNKPHKITTPPTETKSSQTKKYIWTENTSLTS